MSKSGFFDNPKSITGTERTIAKVSSGIMMQLKLVKSEKEEKEIATPTAGMAAVNGDDLDWEFRWNCTPRWGVRNWNLHFR